MTGLLLKKALRDLHRSLAQTIALVVIIALDVASLVALIGAYRDLGTSYDRTYAELHFADVTFAVQSAPESIVGEIAGVSGVHAVTGRLIVDTGMTVQEKDGKSKQVRARLIGIPGTHKPAVDTVLVTKGSYFGPSRSSTSENLSGRALVESHFAKVYDIAPGDTITPLIGGNRTPLEVSGVVASPEYLIVSASRQDIIPSARTFGVLFVPRSGLQKLTNEGGVVNNFAVLLAPGADSSAVIDRIRGLLEPYGLSTVTLQKDQPSASALRLDLEGYREIGYMMPALILLAAAASLFVMLNRQIRSQQTHIGLMKALGYSRGAVLLHYLTTVVAVGIFGAAVGIAAGFPLGSEITAAYAKELGIPLVRSRFYLDLALVGALVTIVGALLAGLFPALRASRMEPAAAMRPDPTRALTRGRRTIFDRLLPMSLWLRLPFRNVFRVRSRSISTLVGIVFAFVLVLSSWALIDSMQNLLYDNFHKVERWDVSAVFDQPKSANLLSTIRSWHGVKQAEPLIQLPVTIRAAKPQPSARSGAQSGTGTGDTGGSAGAPSEQLLLTAMSPSHSLHAIQLERGSSQSEAMAEGKVVISRPTANKLDVGIGDRVALDTPLGRHTLTVGGISNEFLSAVAYTRLSEAESWVPFHTEVFNGLYLTVDPAQASAIKTDLYHLPGAASVQQKSAVEADWQSLMGLYYVFMGVILIFALVMAFAILFNTMTVNVLEQQREFATMRSLGTGGSRVAMLMTVENLLLWAIALVPGLLIGTWAAGQMVSAFQSDAFNLTVAVTPMSYFVTAGGILVTMILAAIPAVRRVNRLNLAEATKVLT